MATLTKAFRDARTFALTSDKVQGLLLFTMILLAVAALVSRIVTGSFFFGGPLHDPKLALALKSEGEKLYNMKRYDAALERLQQAVVYDDKDPQSRYLLANTYLSLGQTKEAMEELKACVRLDEANSGAHYLIYKVQSTYAPASAIKHLRLAKKGDPGSPYLDAEMAQAYRNAGNPAKALEWAQAALRKTPAQSNYRKNLQAFIAEVEPVKAPVKAAGKR